MLKVSDKNWRATLLDKHAVQKYLNEKKMTRINIQGFLTNVCQRRMIYTCNKRCFYSVSPQNQISPLITSLVIENVCSEFELSWNIANYNVNKTND